VYRYAETLVDVIARRTRLGFLDVKATLQVNVCPHTCCLPIRRLGASEYSTPSIVLQITPKVLDLMQAELGWSDEKRASEEADARKFLDTMYLPVANAETEKDVPLEDRLLY
jgi:glycerol-3-phosphate dehydrogenase